MAASGAAAPVRHAVRVPGDRRLQGGAVHGDPEGLLPAAGHRPDPGHYPGAAIHFVPGDGRTPAGRGAAGAGRSGRAGGVVLHRRGRQHRPAKRRAHADCAQAPGRTQRRPAHRDGAPAGIPGQAGRADPARNTR
ncbi:hypothetical protein G6F40_016460 [Rhizopus arrhizus]|nr:hypothetical protein G6F40_016460 [Rhizopus arrhizus]